MEKVVDFLNKYFHRAINLDFPWANIRKYKRKEDMISKFEHASLSYVSLLLWFQSNWGCEVNDRVPLDLPIKIHYVINYSKLTQNKCN